ncbi:GNAT family N-acetyltransferase [Actinomadura rupiterrae]|uniref:GNAT family N-acetyltransferase n=1 Tax=Actinomadura rupiterrae TaxID=559627 RepID=UPI0020A2BB44|nr:GNAT family N-acetyltransferase [Actinomadura rupiterrae]MCP2337285.1 ribosomal protein S18 acetylase RimI-like enzyme [Actinomadura rupiterrae]
MAQAPTPPERVDQLDLRARPYDHPDARHLTAELYREQFDRYGFADAPDDPSDDFTPPSGLFLVAYEDEKPCACGGIHTHAPGVAEIKKLYVAPTHRRSGLGRRVLTALEDAARANGAKRIVLETGSRNVEALALYTRAGYHPIPAYRDRDASINRALAKDLATDGSTHQ